MPRNKRTEELPAGEICIAHCVQRCVRRAFLAGVDPLTGVDYSFRKAAVCRRMEALASVFAVDVLSMAVMSNHFHLVMRNRPDIVAAWSDQEVALRWLKVFPGKRMEEHLAEPTEVSVQMLVGNAEQLAIIRRRLSDISWFMRALCEPIARMANRQDECTGRFWEGRFKSQRITDEAGLLACSLYVDLNPVRAALSDDPLSSPYTSAAERAAGEQGKTAASAAFELTVISQAEAAEKIKSTPLAQLQAEKQAKRRGTQRTVARGSWLAALTLDKATLASDPQVHVDGLRASDKGFLSCSWQQYSQLLQWVASSRPQIGGGSAPPEQLSELLKGSGIDAGLFRDIVWNWQRYFGGSGGIGSASSLQADAQQHGKHYRRGYRLVPLK